MVRKSIFRKKQNNSFIKLLKTNLGVGSLKTPFNRYKLWSPNTLLANIQNLHNYPSFDYAYYMKGLVTFPKAKSFFQSFFNVDISKRDISEARTTINHFSTLVKSFPNSEYTPDALKRMEYLRNLLARHEIHVANYYFERKAYLAAVNRGKYVLENFQKTPAIPDALAVMAQGYHHMGMLNLAKNSISTLAANYPNYPALKNDGNFDFGYNTRKNSSTLLDIATIGLIGSNKPPGFNTERQYNPLKK